MIDVSELEQFVRACEAASADFKPYMGRTLEEIGEKFLDIVQGAIESAGNVDTKTLLSSFTKGGAGNIWQLNTGGLTLTIGTNVRYAKWVNDGHHQQPGRFIPGVLKGDHFVYTPGAKSGIVLKATFVPGSHFFDKSVRILKKLLPQMENRALENFFHRYFP